jgi:outer membrane receptor for ferrienterochelin and colicin
MFRKFLSLVACAIGVALLATSVEPSAALARTAANSKIDGSLIDQAGLPIGGATVDLYRGNGAKVTTAKTNNVGAFSFPGEPAGTYYTIVHADGYQSTQSDDIIAVPDSTSQIRMSLAKVRSSDELKTIGRISSNSMGARALQRSATITQSLDAKLLQQEGNVNALEDLRSLPGITTNGNAARGNDGTLRIRGSKTTEVAVLVDGHPIGPSGAQSDGGVNDPWDNGFNFMATPLFALNNVQVTYGSGALGLFGTSVIGGTVDLQTLNPTTSTTALVRQGLGNQGQSLSDLSTSGTVGGKLGYVFVHGVEGLGGQITPGVLVHSGGLSNNITSAYINSPNIKYATSGNFLLHNDLAKLVYKFDPRTSLTVSAFDAVSWTDSTGDGDNKINTYDYRYYRLNKAYSKQIDSGCTTASPVSFKTDSGQQCFSVSQAASLTSGYTNDGATRQRGTRLNDYNAKFVKALGNQSVTVDVFANQYAFLKDSHGATIAPDGSFIGAQYQAKYNTSGVLVSDDFSSAQNDLGVGFSTTYNIASGEQFVPAAPAVSATAATPGTAATLAGFYPLGTYPIGSNDLFVRDEVRPSDKLSLLANLYLKHSTTQRNNSFDPRLSVIYRTTPNDVARLTYGRADALPSPLLTSFPFTFGTRGPGSTSYVCNGLTLVGSSPNPNILKESATDYELALGHRFSSDSTIQLDGYYNSEKNVIFAGALPLSAFSNINIIPNSLAAYNAALIAACPGTVPTLANYGLTSYFNAASGTSKGIDISGRTRFARHIYADYSYGIDSSYRNGISDTLLKSNKTFINGAQLPGTPLQQGSLGIGFDHFRNGLSARIDTTYIGPNNNFNRESMFYSNGYVGKSFARFDVNVGVTNLFNQYVQVWNLPGYGRYVPENVFGTDKNSFDQGTQESGLAGRSFQVIVTAHF